MDGCGININFPLLYINIRPQDSPHALLESIKPIQNTHASRLAHHLEYSLDKIFLAQSIVFEPEGSL